MISTLSDGWKFEQLVSTGSGWGGGGDSEFLAVVSREVLSRTPGEDVGGVWSEKERVLQSRGSRM